LRREDYFCFQQDSALSQEAKRTQKWLEDNLTDFFSPTQFIHFGQTRLHKTHDFSQIENPLDQDSRRNDKTTDRAVIKERGERIELN
jgi:hypothetical protein